MIYPWLQPAFELLNKQLSYFPQALMLCGQAGLGKATLAKTVAQQLLCLDPVNKGCGVCKSCRLFATDSHPDFFMVQPEEKSQVIKVDQLRNLIRALAHTPTHSACQVVVISPAEAMHRSSANALLKVLEEPAGDVHFILVSHRQGTILPTIMSRCQRFMVSVADQESEMLLWLQQEAESMHSPELLLRLSDHAPLHALSLHQADVLTLRDIILKQLTSLEEEQENIVSVVEQWVKMDQKMILRLLHSFYADMMKLNLSLSSKTLVHEDRKTQLAILSQKLGVLKIQSQLASILQASQLLERGIHLNPQLLMEGMIC